MIGSGWLFGAFYAAQIAGPAALLCWPIAGLMIIVIALCFAELSTILPVAGGLRVIVTIPMVLLQVFALPGWPGCLVLPLRPLKSSDDSILSPIPP